jgi:hypothetical protein
VCVWCEEVRGRATGLAETTHGDEDVGVVQADGDIGELQVWRAP